MIVCCEPSDNNTTCHTVSYSFLNISERPVTETNSLEGLEFGKYICNCYYGRRPIWQPWFDTVVTICDLTASCRLLPPEIIKIHNVQSPHNACLKPDHLSTGRLPVECYSGKQGRFSGRN